MKPVLSDTLTVFLILFAAAVLGPVLCPRIRKAVVWLEGEIRFRLTLRGLLRDAYEAHRSDEVMW